MYINIYKRCSNSSLLFQLIQDEPPSAGSTYRGTSKEQSLKKRKMTRTKERELNPTQQAADDPQHADMPQKTRLIEDLSSTDYSSDDYIPEATPTSTSDTTDGEPDTDNEADKLDGQRKKKVKRTKRQKKKHSTSKHMQHDIADTSQWPDVDQSEINVMTSKKRKDGGRIYNKKFHCLYCSKTVSKMSRHLQSMHLEVKEVNQAFSCPKGSKERKMQLAILLNRGNRTHNNNVIKAGQGTVVPRRQPCQPATPREFVHCVNCEGYFKKKTLWRHMKRCQLGRKVKGLKIGTSRVQAICKYSEPVPESVSANFWNMIQDLRDDEITHTIRKEKYIHKFGEHLFNKHGHDKTKHEYIRQKMREMARLVVQGQKDGNLKNVCDFFIPTNFPHVITAVRNVAGIDEERGTYKTPSLALKSGHNLKKMANIVEYEAMMTGNENMVNNARVFKQLADTKWSECVSSQALRNLHEAKWNVPQLLPFADDIRKMHDYLDCQRSEQQIKLQEQPNKKNWSELAKTTLCEVIIFNRRREGEVSKMTLNAFTLRDNASSNPEVELALSELEKKLCKHFERIEIRGKRGRKVPILLTPNMLSSMELLVKTRKNCEVLDENPYMFSRPQALSYFRGSDVIRYIAQRCEAINPVALSSTKLRKHVATMSKVLNLKENEMDDLANFLGHDIRVHREYYRLPEGTLQLAKISKVLMALERGQLCKFKGKSLDEIDIDPQG